MGDEEDNDVDILKNFLSSQSRDKIPPPKRTRNIRTRNSVLKESSKE
jgi:hypothetical protein